MNCFASFQSREFRQHFRESKTHSRHIAQAVAPHPLRIAAVQSAVYFTDEFRDFLSTHGVALLYTASQEGILQSLEESAGAWDVIIYPIAKHWQRALDFAREVRRVRERQGGQPQPFVLIVSFVEQLPTTIAWFRRTSGTHYAMFTSTDNLLLRLREIQREISQAKHVGQRLHLRLVHAGNPSGLGCITGERLVAIYASFQSGNEREIVESRSVLNFLNLLAINHWRFRSRTEILQLMRTSPFYVSDGAKVISSSSIKTYVARSEAALRALWEESRDSVDHPTVIARQARGSKEVAYRLLCSSEIDHMP